MTGPSPSNFIVERSRAFLAERGDRATEEALLAHVFGQRGRSDVWRGLLRGALEGADGFLARVDGTWELARPPAPTLASYRVIALQASGADPRRQRVIEVAVLRVESGALVGRWSTPLNPERRVADYVRRATGLSQDGLADAPRFAEVVEDLLTQIGDDPLVGHEIGASLAFLNAEMARLERPPLTNPTLDTLPLAVALLPDLRRPDLSAIASVLGLMMPHRRRAEGDAQIVAACFERLRGLARQRGLGAWEDLTGLAASGAPPPAPSATARRGWTLLDRAWLDDIPARPGVYLMRDESGQIIYVGKAKNLRNRVRSYYSQQLGLTRKMDGLLESVRRIDVEVVGSELEALLLESRLIKQELPRYNVQQRNYEHYPFIKVDVQTPYPRVTATRVLADDGARYFGPFRNAASVHATIELLTDLFPVRTCTVKVTQPERRWRPCLRLDLGQCLGPCVGRVGPAAYHALIDDIIAYLENRREPLINRLWEQVRQASDRLDFERAGRLRDAIRHVAQVTISQSLLTTAVERTHRLIVLPSVEPGAREALVIVAGRLIGQTRVPADASPTDTARSLQAIWRRASQTIDATQPVAQATVDEIAIIGRWLHQNEGSPVSLPLPDDPADLAAWELLCAALPWPDATAPSAADETASALADEPGDRGAPGDET